ncbi:hypothetical protein BG015_000655 [Linnemannia schmuckeri]|uniref:Uncharacterized protein n=1 Tax=Linnemannia schmuckeri TaxID=64567 RepID=A0A9P5RSX1_9FUNG|nr:hypothetical protein BG015_000655 [Linnemannia schmuckeri]
MVLWSTGNSDRGRILSSKRTLLSGSLLLLVLFYYVALPDPQAGSLDGRTAFLAESTFHENKKGSALADDTELMMPSLVGEDRPVKTLPWLNSFVERVKVRYSADLLLTVCKKKKKKFNATKFGAISYTKTTALLLFHVPQLDKRLPVTDYRRGEQETYVEATSVSETDCSQDNGASDACLPSTVNVPPMTVDIGMDMRTDRASLAGGAYEDALLESKSMEPEVMEDDEKNVVDVTPEAAAVEDITTTSMNNDWSDEKEAGSKQEEDDEQGSEKEDGTDQELLEQLEEAETVSDLEAEAKAHVEEAEETLEDAIEELREERDEEILDETEDDIMNRLEEAEEEILDRIEEAEEASGEVLTDEMVRMIEDEVVAEEANLDEDMHRYAETLFHGDRGSEDEKEEGYEEEEVASEIESEVAAEAEVEAEYKKEDLLGQAGSGETMDDEQ